MASITDSRVTLVSQAISGVRVMKMSAWEEQFESRISKIRDREIKQIGHAYRFFGINETLFFSSKYLHPFIGYNCYILSHVLT